MHKFMTMVVLPEAVKYRDSKTSRHFASFLISLPAVSLYVLQELPKSSAMFSNQVIAL